MNFWQVPMSGSTGATTYREFYSLPVIRPGGRVKVAPHNHLADCDPETTYRRVSAGELAQIRTILKQYIPSLAARDLNSQVCLYTLTPDGDFSLGPLPGYENVFSAVLAGHGFKFAPVLGEILADMLMEMAPPYDVTLFSPDRFD